MRTTSVHTGITDLLLISGLFFFATLSYAQKLRLPKQRELVISTDTSLIKAYIPVKNKKVNTRQQETYYWFHANNIHSNQGGYTGKLLHGKYTETALHGNLIASGQFAKGQKQGVWKSWDKNGKLLHSETWCRGRKHGRFMYADESNKRTTGRYRKGKWEGRIKQYDQDDKLISTARYKRGEPVPEPKLAIQGKGRKEKSAQKEKSVKEKENKADSSEKSKDKKQTEKPDAPQKKSFFKKKDKHSSKEKKEKPTSKNR